MRKIKILLDALEKSRKKVFYFALDLMYDELVRTLALVPEGTYKHVQCAGLWGTYDDGLAWLKLPENVGSAKAILSMGSSIGNFTPDEAVGFVAQFAAELGPDDLLLIALDGCQDAERVYRAYNDRGDVTHRFTMNGLKVRTKPSKSTSQYQLTIPSMPTNCWITTHSNWTIGKLTASTTSKAVDIEHMLYPRLT